MLPSFWPILLFFLFLLAVAGLLIGVGYVWNPRRPNPVKAMPYESGMDPFHDARRRLDVRFYLLAVAFLVFDVEVLLLYPWAVAVGSGRSGSLWLRQSDGTPRSAAGLETPPTDSQRGSEETGSIQKPPLRSPLAHSASAHLPSASGTGSVPVGIEGAVAAGMIESRTLVLAGALVFIGLLAVGYLYDWRKGILRWR
jgi:NADH-quinone oxidoreductase subunit A